MADTFPAVVLSEVPKSSNCRVLDPAADSPTWESNLVLTCRSDTTCKITFRSPCTGRRRECARQTFFCSTDKAEPTCTLGQCCKATKHFERAPLPSLKPAEPVFGHTSTKPSDVSEEYTSALTYAHLPDPAMQDLMTQSALDAYVSNVNTQQAQTLSQVTEWQALPSNVSTGLAEQYKIMQERLTSDLGQLEIIMTMLGNNGAQNQLGIQVALQHPWSRGTIFINSTDPFTDPLIDPDYFGVGYDIDIMSYGTTFARRLASTAPLSNVMTAEVLPGVDVTGDALNNYTKRNSGTEYHPLGTCSMLPREHGGVVDTNLMVYGSANLRVIDASIMPLQISAHLMASTYGIAEKGADIIKQKHWEVRATNTTGNSTETGGSETTASAGDATDTAVTSNNNVSANSTGGLSNAAKIGVGVGAGVGAAALLAAIVSAQTSYIEHVLTCRSPSAAFDERSKLLAEKEHGTIPPRLTIRTRPAHTRNQHPEPTMPILWLRLPIRGQSRWPPWPRRIWRLTGLSEVKAGLG